jgi:spore coat polysaccharide biosynthesis predicted glycosyltransferase SpsG
MPNILFRADAQEKIGIGDLMSLIYLSSEFKKNGWACFFAVRDYEPALKIIKSTRIDSVSLIPYNVSINKEVHLIKDICRDYKIDCLLMEVTKNNLWEYSELGRPTAVKACINFDGKITSDFDIVVNWCIDSSEGWYRNYGGYNTKFLLGFDYAILPDYFVWERIYSRRLKNDLKRILILTGGIDEFNLTKRIVEVLSGLPDKYVIRIILGPGYRYQSELARFMERHFSNFSLKQNVVRVFEDYMWADVAFSLGGLTSMELVASKTPAVLIAAYKHQVRRCEYLSEKNFAYYAGYYSEICDKEIIRGLEYINEKIGLFRNSLCKNNFRGGNEKIFKDIDTCRQSKQLV